MNKNLITLKQYIKTIFVLSLIILAQSCKKDESPVSSSVAALGVCPPYAVPGAKVRIAGPAIVFDKPDSLYVVKFNGVQTPIDSISYYTRKTLFVTVPRTATTGIVTVSINGQTFSSDPFTILPAVKITSVSPTTGPIESPVVITGQNFDSTGFYTSITFAGIPATIDSITATKIYVKVPPLATSGQISVITDKVATSAGNFTVTPLWAYASMDSSIARKGHTTTLLADGRLLIVGGDATSNYFSEQIFDPVANHWFNAGQSSVNRYLHTATLQLDGRVLVTGGSPATGGSTTQLCDLFDPVALTCTPTGSLAAARQGHTATRLPNGKTLVAGGYGASVGFMNLCELYDPASGQWTPTGNMNTIRDEHAALLLPNGKVLAIGGRNDAATNSALGISTCELYDPASGQWTPTGSLHEPRRFMAAVLLSNGKVLVSGGIGVRYFGLVPVQSALATCELYDPATGQWTQTGSMSENKQIHAMVALPNGKAVVTGGVSAGGGQDGYLDFTDVYDPATGRWSLIGGMINPRVYHSMTLLPNGKLIVIGGNKPNEPVYINPPRQGALNLLYPETYTP